MARPKKQRIVSGSPEISYFKPRGIPMRRLSEVVLTVDECEALRLADLERLNHVQGSERMGVSRATFGRILQKARRTMAEALIQGKAIRVEGGSYTVEGSVEPLCCTCKSNEAGDAEEAAPSPCKCADAEKE